MSRIFHKINELAEWGKVFVGSPADSLGVRIRRVVFSRMGTTKDARFVIENNCVLRGFGNISIGNDVTIGSYSLLYASGGAAYSAVMPRHSIGVSILMHLKAAQNQSVDFS
jgi:hypothetical protein